MRITPLLWISLLLAPLAANAQDEAVDLSLPAQPMFTGEAAFGGGEYTGPRTDTPEYRRGREDARAVRGGCPTGPDGSERTVTGSVTTGIGYASRGGNAHWNEADIHLCKERVSDAGNVNTMHLNLRVGQYDGPGHPGIYGGAFGPYGGYGPYGLRGHFDGFGPGYRDLYGPYPTGRPRTESWTEGRQPWR
ncbi:hypothetical protein CMZ84_05045 [Lysobacteraceae bacterium NML93-0399]|nr:hypothetical protein CMZ84_05045 [Xanthomonadaceae bacterium NML93-0399]